MTDRTGPTAAVAPLDGPPPVPAPAGEPVLQVAGLRCRYGRFVAVDGVDLEVARGEVVALLGTNGAGKTTTLEAIDGNRRPDGGTVRVLGHDPSRHRRRLAERVGVVFQQDGLPDELTPQELVALWRRLRPGTHQPGSARDVLRQVGLDHRAEVRAGQLSGGERRRLDLAVALSTSPELLVLDEPTSGMDPESRTRTWQVLRDTAAEGRTVLLTTHYLEEAEALADRITILHRGRVAAAGSVPELVASQPATIRFRHGPDTDPGSLPRLDGSVRVEPGRRGATVVVRTPALQADLSALLRWADHAGHALQELRAHAASLEDVFLAIARD